jgi:hypothetical protein
MPRWHGLIDMSRLIFSDKAGVFTSLRDATLFTQAHLELGVVTWQARLTLPLMPCTGKSNSTENWCWNEKPEALLLNAKT